MKISGFSLTSCKCHWDSVTSKGLHRLQHLHVHITQEIKSGFSERIDIMIIIRVTTKIQGKMGNYALLLPVKRNDVGLFVFLLQNACCNWGILLLTY
jgi:hypothetical protein